MLSRWQGTCRMSDDAPFPLHGHSFELAADVDPSKPGLYRWDIGGEVYIGKYTKISRPRSAYARNVRRLIEGLPYRRSNPDGWRRVHHAMAAAISAGEAIKLRILENCSPEQINLRERELIRQFGTLND